MKSISISQKNQVNFDNALLKSSQFRSLLYNQVNFDPGMKTTPFRPPPQNHVNSDPLL